MILGLLAVLQVAAADSFPVVTLADALRRGARLDPDYVAALGQVDNAEWARRQALAAFLVPAVTLTADYQRSSPASFNFGTGGFLKNAASVRVDARLDVFTGGQKLFGARAAGASLDAAHAGELAQRFLTALQIESDYYAVIAAEELARVARERVRRAEEQLAVARARVRSGAAVQSDSLQLLLELSRARVTRLLEESGLRTGRLQLGRRIGAEGPVRPAPEDTTPAPPLPFSQEDAVRRALAQGPEYRRARASERAAQAMLNVRRGSYLPRATLALQGAAFDDHFYPEALKRTLITLTVSVPIWDNGNREILLTQARVNRDVARSIRLDLERGAQRDVGAAFDGYETARAAAALAAEAVVVARENYRIQLTRYRSGATTILDLLDAQLALSESEAGLVQARYATRLALASLEAILGARILAGRESE